MKDGSMLQVIAALGGLALAGCGGGGGDGMTQNKPPPVVPHNYRQLEEVVLKTGCANFSVCHSPRGAAAANDLDLSVDAYAALVGAPSVNARAKREGMLRVKPHDPDASLLIVKLELPPTATDSMTEYGGHMPQGNPSLTTEQMQGIRDWIARGALRDEPDDVSGPGVVR